MCGQAYNCNGSQVGCQHLTCHLVQVLIWHSVYKQAGRMCNAQPAQEASAIYMMTILRRKLVSSWRNDMFLWHFSQETRMGELLHVLLQWQQL